MEKAACRIIDANFNRVREALRVMEDFARFHLNSNHLSARVKSLRHELCAAIGKLDAGLLLASRDTPGDVGTNVKIDNQLSRSSLTDCLTAASRRASEGLRTLSETIQTIDPSLASRLESIRYACYTLGKDITLAASARSKMGAVRLYVIITSSLPSDIIRLTQQCCRGGANCLQLRAKQIPDDQLLAIATEFAGICREHGVVSIINDRVDIAAICGADGIHLGQNDLPASAARRLQLSPLIIGKSTHNVKQLQAAIDERADYVGLGPVFPTQTKPEIEIAGLDYLKQAVPLLGESGTPAVAVGGITLDNIEKVRAAGINAVAVGSAIINAREPQSACKAFVSKLLEQ